MTSKLDTSEISHKLFRHCDNLEKANLPGEELVFKASDDTSIVCQYFEAAPNAPVILFFPSTDEDTAIDAQVEGFLKHGISIIYVLYRGSGKSEGSPSLSKIYADANDLTVAVKNWLTGKNEDAALFVMGKSLGSVFAIETCCKNPEMVKGVILESCICKTTSYLQAIGLDTSGLDIEESEGFNNLHKISEIKLPTIIFHGAQDPVVDVAEAESLQSHSGARSKQFFVIPGGLHGNLQIAGGDTYYTTLKTYLDTTCGINTWRQRRRKQKQSG